MSEKVRITLTVSDCGTELPVLDAALGHSAVNIRSLTKFAGLFALDPGLMSTVSYESKVTYIDGNEGLLYYRGYPIEQLAEKSDYLEIYYLLIYGELPTSKQKAESECTVRHHTMVHEQPTWFSRGPRRDAYPMVIMVGVVDMPSTFYQDSSGITDSEHRKAATYRPISRIPIIAAVCCRYSNGLPLSYPGNNLSYSENFMHIMFAMPRKDCKPSSVSARTFDRIFTLHADHEQDASISTMRLTGFSDTNPFACVSAGIACPWDTSHDGVNEAVLLMLDEISGVSYVVGYMEGVKQRKYCLMGFGYRMYRDMDPCAGIMCQACYGVLKELNLEDNPKFKLVMKLEKIALKDPSFVECKLYPNMDLYSGIILPALDVPTPMSTVIFVLARSVG